MTPYTNESPANTSHNALAQIASPGDLYNQPNAAQVSTIFAAIATDIGQGSSRLVDDGSGFERPHPFGCRGFTLGRRCHRQCTA